MSPKIIPFVSKFEIADFDVTLSDVHNPVLLSLCNNNSLKSSDKHVPKGHSETSTPFVRPLWNASMKILYQEALNRDQIASINRTLDQYLIDTKSVDLGIIEHLNSELNDILKAPAIALGSF